MKPLLALVLLAAVPAFFSALPAAEPTITIIAPFVTVVTEVAATAVWLAWTLIVPGVTSKGKDPLTFEKATMPPTTVVPAAILFSTARITANRWAVTCRPWARRWSAGSFTAEL